MVSIEQAPLNNSAPYGIMGRNQILPTHLASSLADENFGRPYAPRQLVSDSEMSWSPNEGKRASSAVFYSEITFVLWSFKCYVY